MKSKLTQPLPHKLMVHPVENSLAPDEDVLPHLAHVDPPPGVVEAIGLHRRSGLAGVPLRGGEHALDLVELGPQRVVVAVLSHLRAVSCTSQRIG